MLDFFYGPQVYLLPKTAKSFFIYLLISSLISLILSFVQPMLFFILLFVLLLNHISALTFYALLNYSEIYLFCQQRKYFDTESTILAFFSFFYFINACIFLAVPLVFLIYISNSITSFSMPDSLGILFCIGIWVSGVSYISVFGFLNKISHRNEHDLPEEIR